MGDEGTLPQAPGRRQGYQKCGTPPVRRRGGPGPCKARDITHILVALGRLEDHAASAAWVWDSRVSARVDWLLVAVEIKERAA